LSQQLSVPWVSLYHIDFSRQLLNLVPQGLAEKYCLVPIFVRRVRGLGETLYVAMDDPSDESAQREISQASGLPVRAMIAPPTDIRAAIRVYYGGGNDSPSLSQAVAEVEGELQREQAEVAQVSEPSLASVPNAELESAVEHAAGPGPEAASPARDAAPELPDRETPPPDSGPEIEAREITLPVSRPAKPRGKVQRLLTLTLLDGTQVKVPTRDRNQPDSEEKLSDEISARDLVAALRAAAHGAESPEILGDNPQWQALFAALLSLLLKKHLINDREFIEEYKKGRA
jgi:type IV pilus assembly protein PilB